MKGISEKIKRTIFTAFGTIFLIIGAIGVFIPILPTTPFLLLAAACYLRGSERLRARAITAPTVLLLTTPFNLYLLLSLSQGTQLSYNLVGLLPYLWGLVSIAGYIKKSSRAMETMIEADLDEAEEIFMESRNYLRARN